VFSGISFFLEFSALYIMVCWGIYLNYRSGQICFTPYAALPIGAYFCALATRDWGWPFGLAILGAMGLAAAFAFVTGLFLARVGAIAMCLVTIAFVFIIQIACINLDFLGGVAGLFEIPRVDYLLPLTLSLTALLGFFVYRFDHSRLGRAMEVAFFDRDVATTSGINLYWSSVLLQVLGGAIGGLVGAIMAPLNGRICPAFFDFPTLVLLVCFIFVGGHTTMWGLVVFTPLLYGMMITLPSSIAQWGNIIFGALLVLIIVLRPEGVITKQTLRSIRIRSQVLLERMRRFHT
jgi:branched-chain amino acid transport system permease protein